VEAGVLVSPSTRALAGRIGGFTRAALYDSREATAPARAKFLERFVDEVDPDRTLPKAERARRALAARRAHFAKLAFRSAQVRAKKAATSTKVTAQEVPSASSNTTS